MDRHIPTVIPHDFQARELVSPPNFLYNLARLSPGTTRTILFLSPPQRHEQLMDVARDSPVLLPFIWF